MPVTKRSRNAGVCIVRLPYLSRNRMKKNPVSPLITCLMPSPEMMVWRRSGSVDVKWTFIGEFNTGRPSILTVT